MPGHRPSRVRVPPSRLRLLAAACSANGHHCKGHVPPDQAPAGPSARRPDALGSAAPAGSPAAPQPAVEPQFPAGLLGGSDGGVTRDRRPELKCCPRAAEIRRQGRKFATF